MMKYFAVACAVVVVGSAILIIDRRSVTGIGNVPGSSGTEITQTIFATGIIEGATEDVHLRAEQNGRVREVCVTVGQWVEAGEVLVRLDDDSPTQEAALASAKLELAIAELERLTNGARAEEREEARALVRAAQARLDQAVRSLQRIEDLRRNHAVTEQEVEDQQELVATSRAQLEAAEARARQLEAPARADELRAAQARVSAAQAELNLANIHLGKCGVRAPRKGRVLDLHVESGELTGPDALEPLVVLSDTSIVRVRAYVEELDAPRVCIGQKARVTADSMPNNAYDGHVIGISPRMETKSHHSDRPNELYDTMTREVLLEIENAAGMIVGLRVDVQFENEHSQTAMVNQQLMQCNPIAPRATDE